MTSLKEDGVSVSAHEEKNPVEPRIEKEKAELKVLGREAAQVRVKIEGRSTWKKITRGQGGWMQLNTRSLPSPGRTLKRPDV